MTTTHMRTRPTPQPVGPFISQHEANAYRELHDHGLAAWDAKWGLAGNQTLNRWHDAKLCRIVHTPTGVTIRTFAKYAKLAHDMTDSEHDPRDKTL